MSKRKDKVFSVSMMEGEVNEIENYIAELEKEHGFSISRNELVRRATLAHIRFMQADDSNYAEIFKKVGKK